MPTVFVLEKFRDNSFCCPTEHSFVGFPENFVAGCSFFLITDEKPDKVEKVDGPPPDPSTAKISSNKESIIEINASNKGLGLFVTGGKMVQPPVVSTECSLNNSHRACFLSILC